MNGSVEDMSKQQRNAKRGGILFLLAKQLAVALSSIDSSDSFCSGFLLPQVAADLVEKNRESLGHC